jgi:hypothetical protein
LWRPPLRCRRGIKSRRPSDIECPDIARSRQIYARNQRDCLPRRFARNTRCRGWVNTRSRTFTQQSAISSIITSSRDHNAAVNCGAVTLVGSVRTRERYTGGDCGEEAAAASETMQNTRVSPTIKDRNGIPEFRELCRTFG